MLRDDLRHVGGLHAGIPHAIGVDHKVRPALAEADRPARGDLHGLVKPCRDDLLLKRLQHGVAAVGGATGDAFRFLLGAHENVVAERLHGDLLSL